MYFRQVLEVEKPFLVTRVPCSNDLWISTAPRHTGAMRAFHKMERSQDAYMSEHSHEALKTTEASIGGSISFSWSKD